MDTLFLLSLSHGLAAAALLPAVAMALAGLWALGRPPHAAAWGALRGLSTIGLAGALVSALALSAGVGSPALPTGLATGTLAAWLAVLVQLMGLVIGAFSARYLEGEPGQPRYVAALAGVLAAVQVLLLADHWLLLIAAWAAVGAALQPLLCFYRDRPFALLAAHKKRLADRLADALLLAAAALAWSAVGSGSLTALSAHLASQAASPALQAAAVCLVLAVLLRTALLPVHGWLIQVMEAPTPVSALLHAGVVNLGGFVLIRLAALLEAVPAARALLVAAGLATAVLAGLVMLTRISIKVRLAWSTVAQMGFLLLECGLGLYTLAALHLVGHSLYKAHAFLSASSAVRDARRQALQGPAQPAAASVLAAPLLALAVVAGVVAASGAAAWPWWWSAVLALAWAPMLWTPRAAAPGAAQPAWRLLAGAGLVAALTVAALLAHALPLGLQDRPDHAAGLAALAGLALLYAGVALLQLQPQRLAGFRRWSYAGFYVDEVYTRLTLRLWPTRWAPQSAAPSRSAAPAWAAD